METNQNNGSNQILYQRLLGALGLIMIWSSFIYYFYALNRLGIAMALVASTISFWVWTKKQKLEKIKWPNIKNLPRFLTKQKLSNKQKIILASSLIITIGIIMLAWQGRSEQALISPWQTVSPFFLVLYATGIILLAFIMVSPIPKGYKILLLSLHYLTSLSLAALIYKIGYGFDSFIHESAMELISQKGIILPKTPYYLGQYGLITILHKFSGISIALINTWLIPVATALLLPYTAKLYFEDEKNEAKIYDYHWLTILFLPIITFSPFIVTTPQNLSYLFLALAVLTGSLQKNLSLVSILVLTTTAIHPLTGLPAIAWCSFLYWQKYHQRLSKKISAISLAAISIFAVAGLPLALLLGGGGQIITDAGLYWFRLHNSITGLTLAGQEGWALNFTYFFAHNFPWIISTLTITSILYYWRHNWRPKATLAIISALTLSYLISRSFEFSLLIDYEQSDYAGRIPIIIIIFALPFLLKAGKNLIKKTRTLSRPEQIIWLFFGTGLMVISLYSSYPRFDNYQNSRGYSTSSFDIATVKSISQDAKQPYIVLANQQVSAAALREIGFDNYHSSPSGPLYTYAIPTGGPLYQYYLEMVYDAPKKVTIKKAAQLAGVDLSYLVINKYWHQSGRIINAAKLSADSWWEIEDEVYIFRYSF